LTQPAGSLRANCLNFWEVLAQSIAMLGPTMTPVLIVPLVFASSGNAGWLAYIFGTVMLLFVALNLREFARRSATAGSLTGPARQS
jgi:amino acid transporter